MRIVIHQPCFLPWLGFFAKVTWADAYVALDDSDFRKRYFHDRAQIIDMRGQRTWIGVPTGQHLRCPLSNVQLNSFDFIEKMIRTIEYAYANAPKLEIEWPLLRGALEQARVSKSLSEFNLSLIDFLLERIGAPSKVPILKASDMDIAGTATNRIIAICRKVGASQLLVGSGASLNPNVHDLENIKGEGITVLSQNFAAAELEYPQTRRRHSGFLANLSVIDALLNIGREGVAELLKGSKLRPEGA